VLHPGFALYIKKKKADDTQNGNDEADEAVEETPCAEPVV